MDLRQSINPFQREVPTLGLQRTTTKITEPFLGKKVPTPDASVRSVMYNCRIQ